MKKEGFFFRLSCNPSPYHKRAFFFALFLVLRTSMHAQSAWLSPEEGPCKGEALDHAQSACMIVPRRGTMKELAFVRPFLVTTKVTISIFAQGWVSCFPMLLKSSILTEGPYSCFPLYALFWSPLWCCFFLYLCTSMHEQSAWLSPFGVPCKGEALDLVLRTSMIVPLRGTMIVSRRVTKKGLFFALFLVQSTKVTKRGLFFCALFLVLRTRKSTLFWIVTRRVTMSKKNCWDR